MEKEKNWEKNWKTKLKNHFWLEIKHVIEIGCMGYGTDYELSLSGGIMMDYD